MTRGMAAAAVAAGALAVPAAAQAHVTVQPTSAAAGAQTVLTVRVPNERDDASTVKVDVRMPPGFASASWEAIPGWSVRAVKEKLATPIQTDDGPIDEQIGEIVWTASSRKDGIAPGEYRDFPLSVVVPGKPGQTLTFKALQTYSNGDVVRWIGAPDADAPAPRLQLTAAASASSSGSGGSRQQANPSPAPAVASSADGGSDTLSLIALALGAIGLVVGGVALGIARGVARRA
jgi:periplasmic copper chaperone A